MDFAKFDRVIRMPGVLDRAISCMQLQSAEHHHSNEPDLGTSLEAPALLQQLQQSAVEHHQDSPRNQRHIHKPQSISPEEDLMH